MSSRSSSSTRVRGFLSNIVGTPPDAMRCDMRVRVVFEETGGDSDSEIRGRVT